MRIQRKLQRIFEQNENLAHFLNYKAQAFYTQRRGPKKSVFALTKKRMSRKDGEPQRKYPFAAWPACRQKGSFAIDK